MFSPVRREFRKGRSRDTTSRPRDHTASSVESPEPSTKSYKPGNNCLKSFTTEAVYYYISVFAKIPFFKISVILCFSVGFAFFSLSSQPSFLSRLSTDLHRTNASSCMRFILSRGICEKLKKPGHSGQKTFKNRSIFRPRRHVFTRDETVKLF